MPQEFTNNGSAILPGDVQPTDTTITLAPGEGDRFPSPDGGDDDSFFLVTLEDVSGNFEIIKIYSRTGDILDSSDGGGGNGRAQEGTTALGFAAGSRCELRLTAGTLGNFKQVGDQYDLRGDTIEADGVRLWHQTDPSSYQYFTLRYYTLDLFNQPIMHIEPPPGVQGLAAGFSVTGTDGAQRFATLQPDAAGDAPAPGTGQIFWQVPGQLGLGRITDPLGAPAVFTSFDTFNEGVGTANRMKTAPSGTQATRFTWSCKDDLNRDWDVTMAENGAIACHAGFLMGNVKAPTVENTHSFQIVNWANPYDAGYDWVAFSSDQAKEDVTRGFYYTFYTDKRTGTDTFERAAVSILDGQVLVGSDPSEDGHLTRKKYVDDQLGANLQPGEGLDAIIATIYGRTVLWNNDGGLNDETTQTLNNGLGFSDFHSIEVTAKDTAGVYQTATIDTATLADKGTSDVFAVLTSTGTGQDNRYAFIRYQSDTTFQPGSAGGSAANLVIVRVIGKFPTDTAKVAPINGTEGCVCPESSEATNVSSDAPGPVIPT